MSAGLDKIVMVWDLESGQAVRRFAVDDMILMMDVRPDAAHAVIAGRSAVPKILDLRSGDIVAELKGHRKNVTNVAYSSDGSLIATSSQDGTIMLWDGATGQPRQCTPSRLEQFRCLAFSPNGEQVVSGTGVELTVWDVAQLKQVNSVKLPTLVSCVAFNSTGDSIAAGGQNGQVYVWDVAKGDTAEVRVNHHGRITAVGFAPDDAWVISSAEQDTRILRTEVSTGETLNAYRGHSRGVPSLTVSTDGSTAVSGGFDGMVKVWDLHQTQEIGRFTGLRPLAIDASGKLIGTSSEYGRRYQVTELASGTERLSLPRQMHGYQAARFSPDNRLLAASSFEGVTSYTLVYDVASGKQKLELRGHSDRVNCLAFHPDGHRLATGSGDKTVKIWDLETGIETLTLRGHSAEIEDLVFRGDGRELMSRGSDGEVRLWNAEKSDPGIARPRRFVLW